MEPHEIIQKIDKLNEEHIGWNMYDTNEGPQPNLKGKVTHKRDAFWKQKVDESVIKELLSLLKLSPADFCVMFNEEDDKFVVYYLPAPFIGSKVIVQKIKGAQLNNKDIALLCQEVLCPENEARVSNYLEAKVETPERVYGPRIKHKNHEPTMIKFGRKTAVSKKQWVGPFHH